MLARHGASRRGRAYVARWAWWQLPRGLRWYVGGVIGAAVAAAGIAAALTAWRARDAVLFGALVFFGAAAIGLTRRTGEPAGVVQDVHGLWLIPVLLLLPPVYCLAAAAITFGVLQDRDRRAITHRQVFSAASQALALAAAAAVFGAVRVRLPWLQPGAAAQTLLWLVIAAACALLWTAAHSALVMTAVKMSDPAVSVRGQLLSRDAVLNSVCEVAAGVVLAAAVADASMVVLLPAVPLVVVLQRSCRHSQLVSQARIDAKTGLLNAGAWRTETTVQLARERRTGAPLALAMVDVDHFKAVNDTHGHLTGDAVLAAIAAFLRSQLRPGDLIGRFGGEEFTVLLPQTRPAEAMQIADRLRDGLARQDIPAGSGHGPLRVTVSVGIAAVADPVQADLTDLLAAADAALYRAKNAGRNQVCQIPIPDGPAVFGPLERPRTGT